MFPEYEPQLNTNIEQDKATSGKSFLFDFYTGEFVLKDGKLVEVEGIESLKVWIQKILKTEKFKFKIYETGEVNEYGVTLLDLINSEYPQIFIQSEIEREITEALLRNSELLSIENFIFTRENRFLIVNFDVSTIHGSIRQEMIF